MTDGSVAVVAPLAGTVVGLAGVPDPVFSAELVGSGTAVEPPDAPGPVPVVAPVAGNLMKVHPHAFVVLTPGGVGVLVHLGIDTVHLRGEGFTVHRAEGEDVEAGTPVVTFSPAQVRGRGLSAVCPVVVLDSPPGAVPAGPVRTVAAGDALFSWPAAR
ncbi:MAG TPA: PTS glucose transporter subunit IIA [Pseudonocardia sp.]